MKFTIQDIMAEKPCKENYPEARLVALADGRESITADEIASLNIPIDDRTKGIAVTHLIGGRGVAKTTSMMLALVESAMRVNPGLLHMWTEPTVDDCTKVFLSKWEQYVPPDWYEINKSTRIIYLKNEYTNPTPIMYRGRDVGNQNREHGRGPNLAGPPGPPPVTPPLRGQLVEHQEEREASFRNADAELKEQLGVCENIMSEVGSMREHLAEMKEQQKNAIRTRTLAEEADRHESEARTLKALSKRLTAALDTLDAYKAELCSGIPIEGLEIDGDSILVDGVPWDQVNTGRQIRVAVELACLRMKGPLKPVFLDQVESLDEDTLRLLLDELDKAGAQPFLARVTEGELKVKKETRDE